MFSRASVFSSTLLISIQFIFLNCTRVHSERIGVSFGFQASSAIIMVGCRVSCSSWLRIGIWPWSKTASTSSTTSILRVPYKSVSLACGAKKRFKSFFPRSVLALNVIRVQLNSRATAFASAVLPTPVGPQNSRGLFFFPRFQSKAHFFTSSRASLLPATSSIACGACFKYHNSRVSSRRVLLRVSFFSNSLLLIKFNPTGLTKSVSARVGYCTQ